MKKIKINSKQWFDLSLLPSEKFKWVKVKSRNKWYDFTNFYQVSNYGRIKSMGIYHGKTNNYFKKEHILKVIISNSGYTRVCLKKYGIGKDFSIHRVVACTFIKNHNNLLEVNHKDGNKLNNCVSNLEWVTKSENVKHAFDNKLKISKGLSMPKELNPNSKFTNLEIKDIREKRKNGIKLKDLASEYNTHISYVCEICKNKHWID